MNPAAILALISELYQKLADLNEENQRLRERLARAERPAETEEMKTNG